MRPGDFFLKIRKNIPVYDKFPEKGQVRVFFSSSVRTFLMLKEPVRLSIIHLTEVWRSPGYYR